MPAFVPENMKLATTPPAVSFDMAGLTQWASGLCEKYNGLVVTEEQVPVIKAEMAELNKAKNQLDIARKETVKRLSEPLKAFEADIRKVTAIFDNAYKSLGEQVKAFAEREREEKRAVVEGIIKEVWAGFDVEPFEVPVDEKWLNKSTSQKAIREAVSAIIQQRIETDALKAQAEQAKQERIAAIEQAVAGHNKNYHGLNLSVSQFLTDRHLNLAVPINEVLASIYADVAQIVERQRKVDAMFKAPASEPAPEPKTESLPELLQQAKETEQTEPVAEASAPAPEQETPVATTDAEPVKLSIYIEFDPSCEQEIKATLATLKSMCVSFAARKCQ